MLKREAFKTNFLNEKAHIYNAAEQEEEAEEEVFAKKMKYLDNHKLKSALFIELENSITFCLRSFSLVLLLLPP